MFNSFFADINPFYLIILGLVLGSLTLVNRNYDFIQKYSKTSNPESNLGANFNILKTFKKSFSAILLVALGSSFLVSIPNVNVSADPITLPTACTTAGIFDLSVAGDNPNCTGKIQYRVIYKTIDCVANTADFEVQVKSDSAFVQPIMGDYNIRLEYDSTVMTRIGTGLGSLVEQNAYSNVAPSSDSNYNSQNLNGSVQNATSGILSINGFYGQAGNGGMLIPTIFKTVSTIRMNIVNPAAPLNIDVHDITSFPITGNSVVVGNGLGSFDLVNAYQSSALVAQKNIDLVGNTKNTLCATAITNPKIELLKKSTVADTNASGTVNAGDVITYNFTIKNTGDVVLTNATIVDPKCTILPATPLATLAVGATDSTTYSCTYVITAGDVTIGQTKNTASVTAKSPTGADIIDVSDDLNDITKSGLDDPTVTLIPLITVVTPTNSSSSSTSSVIISTSYSAVYGGTVIWVNSNSTSSSSTSSSTSRSSSVSSSISSLSSQSSKSSVPSLTNLDSKIAPMIQANTTAIFSELSPKSTPKSNSQDYLNNSRLPRTGGANSNQLIGVILIILGLAIGTLSNFQKSEEKTQEN